MASTPTLYRGDVTLSFISSAAATQRGSSSSAVCVSFVTLCLSIKIIGSPMAYPVSLVPGYFLRLRSNQESGSKAGYW